MPNKNLRTFILGSLLFLLYQTGLGLHLFNYTGKSMLFLLFMKVVFIWGCGELLAPLLSDWIEWMTTKKKVKNILVIGIGGEKGSGKSTAASYLEHDCGYYNTYFAKALKFSCGKVFKLSPEEMEKQSLKEKPFDKEVFLLPHHIHQLVKAVQPFYPKLITGEHISKMLTVQRHNAPDTFDSPRHILQFVGTELYRDCIDEDFHAECVRVEIEHEVKTNNTDRFVISDARFPNERNYIKRVWDGSCVLVKEPDSEKTAKKKDGHASENSLGNEAEYDFVITNEKKSFDLLYDDVRTVLVNVHNNRHDSSYR